MSNKGSHKNKFAIISVEVPGCVAQALIAAPRKTSPSAIIMTAADISIIFSAIFTTRCCFFNEPISRR